MYPDSGWPLKKTEVEFLRRMRDEEGFSWTGYRCVCLPGFKSWRKNKPSMSGKTMQGLAYRGMIVRDPDMEDRTKGSGLVEIELYVMTYEAGEVLKAWDKHEKKGK